MSFGWAVYLQALYPQGKNLIKDDEFNAVGDMLAAVKWELPDVQEYRNDLAQPDFLGIPAVPTSTSHALVAAASQPDPNGPCTPQQWTKVQKMVACLSFSL